jgi:hypothetical protein
MRSPRSRKSAINAVLVYSAERCSGDTKANPTVFAFYPEFAILQIRQKTAFGLVISVRNIVSTHRLFAGYLTFTCHDYFPDQVQNLKDQLYTMKAVFSPRI